MELELHHPHRWERRLPHWQTAAVAGFAAGAVLMVLELTWAASMSAHGPWRIPHLVAALVLGPDILKSGAFGFSLPVVATALATHYVLGIVFGVVLAFIVAGFHYDTSIGMVQILGAVFGVALYLVNFHVLTMFFPWFAELRGWGTLMAHLAFGVVAALLYWKLAPSEGS
ncbi:hypothetical protein [Aquabacterium sp.]|uniref:hypothetical protein n=1 Tax=Aquabacterium sp. TaxID=1872578 RepID=UPI002BDC3E75|nr:hypothetical protein [Aquabacterium sp.]HSW02954.1 hypothetical protein [Aquabacterium sp.]